MHLLLFLSPEWLYIFLSHDYFSYIISLVFYLIIFCFSVTKGQASKRSTLYYPYRQYNNLFIFRFVSLLCLPQHTTFKVLLPLYIYHEKIVLKALICLCCALKTRIRRSVLHHAHDSVVCNFEY